MKITNIYTESYRWPKPQVVTSGRGRGTELYQYNNLALVYVETDEGYTGVGSGMRVEQIEGQEIHCTVENCAYHAPQNCCSLKSINVGCCDSSPTSCKGTECASFQLK